MIGEIKEQRRIASSIKIPMRRARSIECYYTPIENYEMFVQDLLKYRISIQKKRLRYQQLLISGYVKRSQEIDTSFTHLKEKESITDIDTIVNTLMRFSNSEGEKQAHLSKLIGEIGHLQNMIQIEEKKIATIKSKKEIENLKKIDHLLSRRENTKILAIKKEM